MYVKEIFDNIRQTCAHMVGKDIKSIGSKPVSLDKENLFTICNKLYAVTDKTDGERYFMIILYKYAFLVDSNGQNMIYTNINFNNYDNCIIDGEYVKEKNTFYGFDLLHFNNNNIVYDNNWNLVKRLSKLNDIQSDIKSSSNTYYKFEVKYFSYNTLPDSQMILDDIKYNSRYERNFNDGLIYTPVYDSYGCANKSCLKTYKWKPEELNTIDFFSKKFNNVWKLFVLGKNNEMLEFKVDGNKLHFNIDDAKLNSQWCKFKNSFERNDTYETVFDNDLDPVTNSRYETDTVIEYKWDGDKFVPLRSRPDKTADISKHGNYYTVTCNIWKTIMNPISTDDITKYGNDNVKQLIKKHNRAKSQIIYRCVKPDSKSYVLDCGVGTGGDLEKWKMLGDIKILGIDPSEQSLVKARELAAKFDMKNIKFEEGDITSFDCGKIPVFDKICYNFSFHYIVDSMDESIETISNCLKDDGLLFGITPDADRIKQFLGGETKREDNLGNFVELLDNDRVLIYINSESKPFYKEGARDEPLLRKDVLFSKMKEKGFETILWDPMFYERTGLISDIYTQFIFKKVNRDEEEYEVVPKYYPESPTYMPRSPSYVPVSSTYIESPSYVPVSPIYLGSPSYVPRSP